MIEMNYDNNLEEYNTWERYHGYLWARILDAYNCKTNGNIVEIAPGTRYKMGVALSLIKFTGNFYVIEPNEAALNSIIKQYKDILPNANVIGLKCTFRDSIYKLPQNIDAVLSNHGLDDILISECMSDEELEDIFGREVDKEYSLKKLFEKWRELEGNRTRLEEVKKKLVDDWIEFITVINPQLVVLSQFECYFYTKTNGFPFPDASGFEVLKEIKKMLVTDDKLVKTILDSCEAYGDIRVIENNQNYIYWAAGYPIIKRSKYNVPIAYKRLGSRIFITSDIYKARANYEPIYINKELFEKYFNMEFEWGKASEIIKDYFSITLDKRKGDGNQPIGCAYVDKQKDSSDIALDGNLGSGRAYYVDNCFNIKGEKTLLATSKNSKYNNGKFALTSAIFEAIISNIISKEFETGCFKTLAVVNTGEYYDFGWSNGEIPCGQIIRVDENGELDRITHLYENNTVLNKDRLLNVAKKIGLQEGDKFIEKILHGAWSAGNVSPNGHMIDLETVSVVEGRHPQYSFTNKYITNFFGYEYLGQIKMLEDLVNSDLNIDNISIEELESELIKDRKEKMVKGFISLMGLRDQIIKERKKDLLELTEIFEQLSKNMYPNFCDLGVGSLYCEETFTLDFSKFFRCYPILKMHKSLSMENAFKLLVNEKAIALDYCNSNENSVCLSVRDFFYNQNIVSQTKEKFFEVLSKAASFVQKYDALYSEILRDYYQERFIFERNAYLYNESRRMLCNRDNIKSSLINLYKHGVINSKRLNELVNLIIDSSLRKAGDINSNRTNVRVFLEGIFSTYLDNKGKHYFQFILFKDTLNTKMNSNYYFFQINNKPYKCDVVYDKEGNCIVSGVKMDNIMLCGKYEEIYLYVNNEKFNFTSISQRDIVLFNENNLAKLL